MSEKTSDQNAEYKASIVTFFDMLGFRSFVMNSNAPEVIRHLLEYKSFTSTATRYPRFKPTPKLFVFSDSVIRANGLSSTDPRKAARIVFQEIIDVGLSQADLIVSRILVRGGMTIGDIYFQQDMAFGPGFVEAYELESQVATYPRVILSPKVLQTVKLLQRFQLRSYDNDTFEAKVEDLIFEGEDGVWYVDYMRILKLLAEPGLYEAFLSDHATLIERNLIKPDLFSSKDMKYRWLAKYHNRTVLGISDEYVDQMDCSREEFLIDCEIT